MAKRSEFVNNGDPEKARANCPGNDKLVFGGVEGDYQLASGIAMPFAMYQKSEGVEVMAAGELGSDQKFTALAYCR